MIFINATSSVQKGVGLGESLFWRREQWIRTSSGFLNGGGHPIEKFVLKDIIVWDGGNIHPGRFIGVDPRQQIVSARH